MSLTDPSGLFPIDDETGNPIPRKGWRPWEMEVTKATEAEVGNSPVVTNRAARDPNTGEKLLDSTGTFRRPDNQVFDPNTGEPILFREAATGGARHFVRKVGQLDRLLEIAGQYENAPKVELFYRLRIGNKVFLPLMIFDSYIQFLELLQLEQRSTVAS
jgi:hypothetical protein